MGAGSSSEVPGGGTEGYHVLRVQEGSPGYKAGLEPFFDFIVAVEDHRLDTDNDALREILKKFVEKPVKVLVYSSKTRRVREASITPSNLWGGQGLLGVSIRFCSFDGAADNVWHVLDVITNSPADIAGLRPHTDYIIGADSVLHDAEDFFNLVESHECKALKLYVYNSETDGCREVTITPNSQWGGEGSMGCGIGYGYLHRIPVPDETKPPQPPHINASTAGVAGFSEIPLIGGSPPPAASVSLDVASIENQLQQLHMQPTAGTLTQTQPQLHQMPTYLPNAFQPPPQAAAQTSAAANQQPLMQQAPWQPAQMPMQPAQIPLMQPAQIQQFQPMQHSQLPQQHFQPAPLQTQSHTPAVVPTLAHGPPPVLPTVMSNIPYQSLPLTNPSPITAFTPVPQTEVAAVSSEIAPVLAPEPTPVALQSVDVAAQEEITVPVQFTSQVQESHTVMATPIPLSSDIMQVVTPILVDPMPVVPDPAGSLEPLS